MEQETRDFFRAVKERKDAFDDLEKAKINLENNVGSSAEVNYYQRLYSEAAQKYNEANADLQSAQTDFGTKFSDFLAKQKLLNKAENDLTNANTNLQNVRNSTVCTCFLPGTLISTPTGERPIETLQPGDLIITTEGPQPVRFLARSTRSIAQLQALGKMPIRINQAAFGCLGPVQDTFLSPSHAIHFAGSLVEAGALINGTSIQQLNDWPEAALTYYNIELERHGLITANGLLAESYFANYRSNGFSRDCWDNYHDYVALYGAGDLMEELPLPRIPFARQIPMQLLLALQAHEDNFKAANPAIAESGVDQFAGLCL